MCLSLFFFLWVFWLFPSMHSSPFFSLWIFPIFSSLHSSPSFFSWVFPVFFCWPSSHSIFFFLLSFPNIFLLAFISFFFCEFSQYFFFSLSSSPPFPPLSFLVVSTDMHTDGTWFICVVTPVTPVQDRFYQTVYRWQSSGKYYCLIELPLCFFVVVCNRVFGG